MKVSGTATSGSTNGHEDSAAGRSSPRPRSRGTAVPRRGEEAVPDRRPGAAPGPAGLRQDVRRRLRHLCPLRTSPAAGTLGGRERTGPGRAPAGCGTLAPVVRNRWVSSCRAVSRTVPASAVSTTISRGPSGRPWPRTRSTETESSQSTWSPSVQWTAISSRWAKTAGRPRGPWTACLSPGTRPASARASTGRSSALLGCHRPHGRGEDAARRGRRVPPAGRRPRDVQGEGRLAQQCPGGRPERRDHPRGRPGRTAAPGTGWPR